MEHLSGVPTLLRGMSQNLISLQGTYWCFSTPELVLAPSSAFPSLERSRSPDHAPTTFRLKWVMTLEQIFQAVPLVRLALILRTRTPVSLLSRTMGRTRLSESCAWMVFPAVP